MESLAIALSDILRARGLKLVTAESCTGGMVAVAITDLSGSSVLFDRGFVTYSNEAKTDCLGVSPDILSHYGAVSAETAGAMVTGALSHSMADVAVAITGIAGPTGGSIDKPVGLVFIGIGLRGQSPTVTRHVFTGDRAAVREQASHTAMKAIIELLSGSAR